MIGQAFTRPLAKWALELTDCPEGVYKLWLDLLQTPLEEAWCLDCEILEEIQEHLQAELPINNDQAIAVLHQINKLVTFAKQGFIKAPEDESMYGEDQFRNRGKREVFPKKTHIPDFDILEDTEEKQVPPEPERKDYPNLPKYLKAKAGWDLLIQKIYGTGRKGDYPQF
jgi:hypothetical protein